MKSTPSAQRRSRKLKPSAFTETSPTSKDTPVIIVGIGASAGGLEALDQFLGQTPANSGMAFVVVQHLDPTRKGLMPQLLQRATSMKVIQVKDRTTVRPNTVYVIPPNRDMSVLHGVLHLLKPTATRGMRLPIDHFLRSLAQDQQQRSVGVILSGMGSDGTLGLRAIKEKAGVVMAQDPSTAKFDSMPRSAIEAGLVDIVAPAGELPGKIIAYLQHTPQVPRTDDALEDKAQGTIEKVVILLRAHTGNDFFHYKRSTLHRRIERRMGLHQIKKMASYVRYLEENTQELDLLFKELLIGVTHFFRDSAAWDQLSKDAIPALLARHSSGKNLRAWVPGCSTGEEAYSLAMVFKEALERDKTRRAFSLQIFATDLDRDAIEKARQGLFPASIASEISPARLKRFFNREEQGYRVCREIRDMVLFAPQNLLMDPPFTKLDILSCRNLIIYLTAEAQKKLIPLFHYSLASGGILFQGSAETIGDFTHLFTPLNAKSRIFQRLDSVIRPEQIAFPSSFTAGPSVGLEGRPIVTPPATLQAMADQLVLRDYSPPTVLTNLAGDIFYVSGRTGNYLEPAAGKANWNLFAMAREGLRYELEGAFKEAQRTAGEVTVQGLRVETNGGIQSVNVTLRRLQNPGPLQGLVIIVFADVAAAPMALDTLRSPLGPKTANPRVAELELELSQVLHESRATHEEMQTSQEELRAANEELQSTNEELQSTNEELTTSKEEMQSMNEELQTVNSELQVKVDELSHASNDMKNLLDSTDIATLFLDKQLHVRRFTPQAAKIIKLIAGDAGRPITDLSSDLHYPELTDDAFSVLRNLVAVEKTVGARDGRWFAVRIMPYRTLDDRIDGVVITFTNITESKKLEKSLRGKHSALEKQIAGDSARDKRTTPNRKSKGKASSP